jgi:hypothetical protein
MDDEDADPPLESRPPTLADLVNLCRHLNAAGAKYLVVGGMAIIQHGFTRATEDVDLLVEDSKENQAKVFSAMETLPDQAIRELGDSDLRDYVVVRVADEFVVDLMTAACGISYQEASPGVEIIAIDGVPIPFASPALLLRMKQTFREKDAMDRIFLQNKIAGQEQDF